MINTLRQAVGVSSPQSCVCDADEHDGIAVLSAAPTSVTDTIDVRPMIAQGNHPKDIVIKRAAELSKGETLELIAPFVPAPLLDILLGQGFAVSMLPPSTDGTVRAFLRKIVFGDNIFFGGQAIMRIVRKRITLIVLYSFENYFYLCRTLFFYQPKVYEKSSMYRR